MDAVHIPDDSQYVEHFNQLLAAAERASHRKGESVTDHPPAQETVASFLWNLQMNRAERSDPSSHCLMATTQVPAPYPPCTRSLRDLKPTMISAMKLETHHRGTKPLLRVMTPPDRMNAAMVIVEDQEGTAVLLQLYHLPELSVVPTEYILYEDRVCILKEPYFKTTTYGSYSLRVDHVNDLVWLAPDDEHIPAKWRRKRPSGPKASLDTRMQGNNAVQKGDWAKADILYSLAINTAATLELGRFENALADAVKASLDDKSQSSEKALFREAKALYAIGNYRGCMEKLVVLAKEFPDNQAVKPELDRAQARLREQLTGVFPFRRMYKEAEAGIPLIDCATYIGPVEIRTSPGRGRGLFTTSAVAAGDLLLCEKAFSYCYVGDDNPESIRKETILMDLGSKTMTVGGQAQLISQTIQELLHNPKASKKFLELNHGEYQAVSADEVDGRPVVDSFFVTKTVLVNSFSAPRTARANFRAVALQIGEIKDRISHGTSGIWIMASYLNHSCVGNCRRSFIGDMHIIRATRDIPPGTELFFNYRQGEASTSHAETQRIFKNWGFQCDCALCLAKMATSDGTLKRRKELLSQLKYIVRRSVDPRSIDTQRALAVLEKIESTYETPVRMAPSTVDPGSAGTPPAQIITPRLELWDPYFGLGSHLLNMGKKAEAVRVTCKGLEALGFVITATPPSGGVGGKSNKKKAGNSTSDSVSGAGQLVVESWGMIVDYVVPAFLTLFRAYEATVPDLAHKAREYAATAYSMLVGENETFYDEIPEFLL
ncbi:hypothetical protein PG985_014162 [Apiospora marii]|uniref:SET domain-containing protein n=1 Tax=Apiospora marii TaxID=335849 RepID=A0ABR1R6G6_9PEZI